MLMSSEMFYLILFLSIIMKSRVWHSYQFFLTHIKINIENVYFQTVLCTLQRPNWPHTNEILSYKPPAGVDDGETPTKLNSYRQSFKATDTLEKNLLLYLLSICQIRNLTFPLIYNLIRKSAVSSRILMIF